MNQIAQKQPVLFIVESIPSKSIILIWMLKQLEITRLILPTIELHVSFLQVLLINLKTLKYLEQIGGYLNSRSCKSRTNICLLLT